MTTIGSTPYYTSTSNSGSATKSNAISEGNGIAPYFQKSGSNVSQHSIDSRMSMAKIDFQGKLSGTLLTDILKPVNIAELPEESYQAYVEGMKMNLEANKEHLENQYTERSFPETAATQSYANVVVNGKVVAEIDNQGLFRSDNDFGKNFYDTLIDEVNGTNGPDLAQARAEQIADYVGGRVVKTDTAITQTEFEAIEEPQATVDYEGMKNDPMYDRLQRFAARIESIGKARGEYLAAQNANADTQFLSQQYQ